MQETFNQFTSTQAIEHSINSLNTSIDRLHKEKRETGGKRRRKSRKPMSMTNSSPSKVDVDESVVDEGEVKDVITMIEGSSKWH